MSIFIPWWAWPILTIVFMVLGLLFGVPRDRGVYDFGPAMVALAWLIGGIAITIGLIVGHFL